MDSSIIIAVLAIFTIGGTLTLAIFHFGFHLKDPANLEAAKRVAADRESATTKVSSTARRAVRFGSGWMRRPASMRASVEAET